ncbi:hypothetical protein DLW97_06685 [Shigella boydii]|nr:hypothetical protein [Shigella boydii]EFZ0026339.1 hypothetical protein [Shigella dysenteriae]EFY9948709.1 hypothetical protein [Shigella boydii]EFZ0095541.1 hypothetical protein [Shigella boydii]EGD9962474.1 hypothetical protein [Shigella boydii]
MCGEQSPHIRLSGQSGKAPALHFRPRSVMAAGESYQMLSINRVGTELWLFFLLSASAQQTSHSHDE